MVDDHLKRPDYKESATTNAYMTGAHSGDGGQGFRLIADSDPVERGQGSGGKHLRTTNSIESTFATVRHRTIRSKGSLSNKTALAMVFKLVKCAEMLAAPRWS